MRSFEQRQTAVVQAETFVLTGKDRQGKRFRKESTDLNYLQCHNVWQGNLWAVLPNGKRVCIKQWSN